MTILTNLRPVAINRPVAAIDEAVWKNQILSGGTACR